MQAAIKQSQTEIIRVKVAVRERDGYCCTLCGMTNDESISQFGKQLDVHRNIPGSYYTIGGCITVCRTCHGPLPRSPKGTGPSRGLCPREVFQLSWELRDALDAYRFSLQVPLSKSEIIRIALEEYLAARGEWPPPDPKN